MIFLMVRIAIKDIKYNFPYAGHVNSGSLGNVGSFGLYWSRTVYSSGSQSAYGLGFVSSSAGPAYFNYRYLGFSIRCVATT